MNFIQYVLKGDNNKNKYQIKLTNLSPGCGLYFLNKKEVI